MLPSVLICLGTAAGSLLAARQLIHYFQLESYQFPGYFRTIRRNLLKAVLPGLCLALLGIVCISSLNLLFSSETIVAIIHSLIMTAGGFAAGRTLSERKAKKSLVFTPRIKRLYAVSFLVMFLILFSTANLIADADTGILEGFYFPAVFILLFPVFLPFWIALCGLLAWPVEKGISELYFRDAQHILQSRKDLIRIGITGSWGKTSVKFILGTMLEEKYHTLVTPSSFNTPMGVTKIIRSRLEPGHRVFVAEMGARHVGDIREMCRLVHPQYGILTSVGPQHLDTFKTVERVTGTKYELIEALPENGCSFFADDDGICLDLYAKTRKDKSLAGLDSSRDDVWAEDIDVSCKGSTFFLCSRDMRIRCNTSLLGELNIRNIVLCASVCLKLGLSGDQIARGISKLKPVDHRLQLLDNPGGMTVIDDAFNSNIIGANQAFKVLALMQGNRILVTPGMVELGEMETEMNRQFGRNAASCCDTAVLIGKKRSEAISEGLTEGGFDPNRIHITGSLEEATVLLSTLAKAGDTVLFENDLPDNYTE